MNGLTPFILSFIPIFVAVDCLGIIPIFISLTEGMDRPRQKEIVWHTVATATIVALIFMVVGKLVLRAMGITIDDFKVAGGVLLLVLSINLLLPGKSKGANFTTPQEEDVGVFPLGTPLITGPAVLTTTLMSLDIYGPLVTFVSLILNMFLVWLSFNYADKVMGTMGKVGLRAFSKVMDIFLAAIAVMMVRKGVMGIFGLG